MAIEVKRALNRRADPAFYTAMAVLLTTAVLLGFAPTFYLRGYLPLPLGQRLVLPSLVAVHGFVNTLWFALFLTQTLLVARSRTDLHRRLGVLGAVLAVAVVGLGTLTSIEGLRYSGVSPEFDGRVFFLGGTLPSFAVFGLFVALALGFRRRPEIHKRLMLLATIKLMSAGLDRVFLFYFDGRLATFVNQTQLATDLFIIAAVLYDLRTRGRVHPALMWGGAAMALLPLLIVIAGIPAGLALADRFR